ncbi:zf-CCHC domain-containing protein [Tanacetum coccineum]
MRLTNSQYGVFTLSTYAVSMKITIRRYSKSSKLGMISKIYYERSANSKESSPIRRIDLAGYGVSSLFQTLFETYVKSKDIDLWNIIVDGDYKPTFRNTSTALDEYFSSRNHVRKFLRALPTKWRPKVTVIEESKDLSTLFLDELISNLKVYEVVLEKDSEASKNKKEKYKSLALKEKMVSSYEDVSSSDSKANEDKRGKVERKCFKCGDPNHFISDCPKHSYNDQKAFFGGSWSDSDEDEDLKKDEICLMAHDSNEVHSDTLYYSSSSLDDETLQNEYNKLCKINDSLTSKLAKFENSSHFQQEMIENQRLHNDKNGLGFTEHKALTSGVKTGKTGKIAATKVIDVPTQLDPSERDLASVVEMIRETVAADSNLKPILQNRTYFVQVTKKTSPSTTIGNTKQPPALKLWQGLAKSKIQTRLKTSLRRPNTVFPKSNYNQVCLKVKFEPDEWIKDSRCARHMTGNKAYSLLTKPMMEANKSLRRTARISVRACCLVTPSSNSPPFQRFSPPSDYQTAPPSIPLDSPPTTPLAPPGFSPSELLATPKTTPPPLTTPPLPPQLPPFSQPMWSNDLLPPLTHETFCEHCQQTQVIVNDLRDEIRFILNHILERLTTLTHQNFPWDVW